jgi:hypothetical protein
MHLQPFESVSAVGSIETSRVDSTRPSLREHSASRPYSPKQSTSNDVDLKRTPFTLIARSLPKSSIPDSIEQEMPSLLLPLQQPHKISDRSPAPDLEPLITAHFLAFQMPDKGPTVKGVEWTLKLASKQIHILHKAFPTVSEGSSLLAMCAWFHLFCFFDDETEKMSPREGQTAIGHCVAILRASCRPQGSISRILHPLQKVKLHRSLWLASRRPHGSKVAGATYLFTRHVTHLLSPAVYQKTVDKIIAVFTAYSGEFDVRAGIDSLSIDGYMASRTATIGLAPFWENMLDFFLRTQSPAGHFQALEITRTTLGPLIATVVGLQNDMVGLAKDLAAGDRMNYVVLLADRQFISTAQALANTIELHNTSVHDAVQGRQLMEHQPENPLADAMHGFMDTHLAWASGDERYKA